MSNPTGYLTEGDRKRSAKIGCVVIAGIIILFMAIGFFLGAGVAILVYHR